jgi:hypothetical protein
VLQLLTRSTTKKDQWKMDSHTSIDHVASKFNSEAADLTYWRRFHQLWDRQVVWVCFVARNGLLASCDQDCRLVVLVQHFLCLPFERGIWKFVDGGR